MAHIHAHLWNNDERAMRTCLVVEALEVTAAFNGRSFEVLTCTVLCLS